MYDLNKLQQTANLIRQDVVKILVNAGSGHSAGSLGMVDVLAALYFYLLKHDSKNPGWESRDRLILSNGHICPALYTTLAQAGYFPKKELLSLRQLGSRLQGHPVFKYQAANYKSKIHKKTTKTLKLCKNLPGIENTSGPLGQGISQAVGLAIVGQMNKSSWRVVCLTSDGEQQEGQVWEAYLLACKYHLGNLIFILDRNSIQIDGYTYEVLPLEPLAQKYSSFGLYVLEIDGHNFEEIIDSYQKALTIHDQPTIIIAHTIAGKDIEFMENLSDWHGKTPGLGETVEALRRLRGMYGKIDGDI